MYAVWKDVTAPTLSITITAEGNEVYATVKASDNHAIKSITTTGLANTSTSTDSLKTLITGTGDCLVTVTDLAGNQSKKTIKLYMIYKPYEKYISNTGGWNQNYFKGSYGNISNIHYEESNGCLCIGATPIAGWGRLGSYYTNNKLPVNEYDTLLVSTYKRAEGSTEGTTTNVWLDGSQVSSSTLSDFYTHKIDLTSQTTSKVLAIGCNGNPETNINMYFYMAYMYKII